MDGVYIMNADGSILQAFPTGLDKPWEPAWSPDGRHLFSQSPANPRDLATAKHDRSYLNETPFWLPNGSLLFQSTRDGAFEIYRINADGSGQRRISR